MSEKIIVGPHGGILYVIVFIKVLCQRWCSVDDCVVEQTGDVKSVIPFEHLDGWWEHAVSSFRSLLTEDSKTSPHDSPDDGQAVIFLTGFLEVFVYKYFWNLDFGNSIGQHGPLSSRQCWYGKHEHSGSLHSCTIIESDMPNEILMLIYVNVRLVEALILSFRKFEHFLCNCWVVEHLIKVSSQSRGLGSCWQNE